jgi:3-hydroxybutyryl-CoA dehydratase
MDSAPSERTSFTVGEEATFTKTITEEDLQTFGRLSGDTNPIHFDENYAKQTRFGGRIVHGMLVGSLISTVLGTMLPGPGCVYLSQQLSFRAPARMGEWLTARVRVTDWDVTRGRMVLDTEVINERNERLIVGEAKMVLASFLK